MLSAAPRFSGKIGYIQRILPTYRHPYFKALGNQCAGGVSVFFGDPAEIEGVKNSTAVPVPSFRTVNCYCRRSKTSGYFVCYQRNVLAWLRSEDPDILIAEANPRLISTILASRWMHKRGRRILGHGLGTMALSNTPRFLRKVYLKLFLSIFDGIIAYSTVAAAQYQEMGISPDRVFVAHNAVAPRPTGDPPVRAPVGATPRVLFLGRLTRPKKPMLLVDAASECASNVQLVFVGSGPELDSLQDRVRLKGVNAVFHGHLRGEKLATVLFESDVLVIPGLGGLAVQDAMARGLPVIVGAGDGSQFDSVREENGWHLATGTSNELARCLDVAFSDPLKLRRMGGESFRIVRDEINLESMVQSVIDAAVSSLTWSAR